MGTKIKLNYTAYTSGGQRRVGNPAQRKKSYNGKTSARGNLLKSKRHKGTDDDSGVQNVPQVAAVGARVKQDAQVDDLKRANSDVLNRVGEGKARCPSQ